MFLEDKSTPAADMLQMLQQQHDDLLSETTPSNMPPPGQGMGAEVGAKDVREEGGVRAWMQKWVPVGNVGQTWAGMGVRDK